MEVYQVPNGDPGKMKAVEVVVRASEAHIAGYALEMAWQAAHDQRLADEGKYPLYPDYSNPEQVETSRQKENALFRPLRPLADACDAKDKGVQEADLPQIHITTEAQVVYEGLMFGFSLIANRRLIATRLPLAARKYVTALPSAGNYRLPELLRLMRYRRVEPGRQSELAASRGANAVVV